MKRLLLILIALSLAGCGTVARLTGHSVIPGDPVDFIGQIRKAIVSSPEGRAFVIRDASAALRLAEATNETHGMTCMPAIIECANDPDSCFADTPTIAGVLSFAETRITGVSPIELLLPKKLTVPCAGWFLAAVMKARH